MSTAELDHTDGRGTPTSKTGVVAVLASDNYLGQACDINRYISPYNRRHSIKRASNHGIQGKLYRVQLLQQAWKYSGIRHFRNFDMTKHTGMD
jgi:hypothetical protein